MKFYVILLVLTIGLISCGKKQAYNDGKTPENYSLGVSDVGISYAVPTSNVDNGTIAVKENGVAVAATSMITSGKYMYFFNRLEKKFYQYELKADGSVQQKASLAVGPYIQEWAYSQNLVDETTILLMDPIKWGESEVKWLTIRIPNFVISGSGRFHLPAKEISPGVKWKSNVGNGRLHGNKFLMGTVYYDFNGNFAPGAHVVSFDYPGMSNPTLISTNQVTAELGIYSTNGFVTTDHGDLYIAACRGALWGAKTDSDVYGGILRIKKGENRFDQSYFFDLSKAVGSPSNILQLDYIGGESAVAILFDDTRIKGWGDIANDHYFFTKVNLETGEILRYNIPKSDAHSAKRPLIFDKKYISFLKSTAKRTTNVLKIDLLGGSDAYSIGALIIGQNVKGYSVTRHPSE